MPKSDGRRVDDDVRCSRTVTKDQTFSIDRSAVRSVRLRRPARSRDFRVPVLEHSAEHNELDSTPRHHDGAHRGDAGFPWGSWPRDHRSATADLQRHAEDFRTRKGFTYTVLDPAGRDVIGCVYIYPLRDSDNDACARSWVRDHAHLDTPLGTP